MGDVPGNPKRRAFLTRMLLGLSAFAGSAVAFAFLRSLRPGADRPQATHVTIDASGLQPGEMLRVATEVVPVCVLRRTKEMLAGLQPSQDLLDAESRRSRQPPGARNPHRSMDPEWFVFVPLCTHLGCEVVLSTASASDPRQFSSGQRGLFCPCHMARFDLAGRARANEPPTANLYVPDYRIQAGAIIEVVLPRNPQRMA